jgi:methyltransferase family protein
MNLGYRDVGLLLRTLRCRVFGTADLSRWAQLGSHDVLWSERSRLIATLIPAGSTVIEFGAGRRATETFLKPGCKYVPSDLVSRGDDTIICDLNQRPLPDLRSLQLDAAVFGGVLEYIQDLPSLLAWLAPSVTLCVASYECARSRPGTFSRFQEHVSRAWSGWVNTYDEDELVALFQAAGFSLSQKLVWQTDEGDEPVLAFQQTTSHVRSGRRR